MQVNLKSKKDSIYQGIVHLGSPKSQPAKVVFDTGSEFLTVTTTLCDDRKAGKFMVKKYDPLTGTFVRRIDNVNRCNTNAYNPLLSKSQKRLSTRSARLVYGSAMIYGFVWQDLACIKPLSGNI